MNTTLATLMREVFCWYFTDGLMLRESDLDLVTGWVEADRAAVDEAIRSLRRRLYGARAFEVSSINASLSRLLARAGKLQELDEAIRQERRDIEQGRRPQEG